MEGPEERRSFGRPRNVECKQILKEQAGGT